MRQTPTKVGHAFPRHHLRHWVDGGETTAGNMTSLCTYQVDGDGNPSREGFCTTPVQRGWSVARCAGAVVYH
jgi:hypothetical protein